MCTINETALWNFNVLQPSIYFQFNFKLIDLEKDGDQAINTMSKIYKTEFYNLYGAP